jgi:hypothetical protein
MAGMNVLLADVGNRPLLHACCQLIKAYQELTTTYTTWHMMRHQHQSNITVCKVGDRVQVLALPCSTPLGFNSLAYWSGHGAPWGWEEDRQFVPLWSLLPYLLCHCLGRSRLSKKTQQCTACLRRLHTVTSTCHLSGCPHNQHSILITLGRVKPNIRNTKHFSFVVSSQLPITHTSLPSYTKSKSNTASTTEAEVPYVWLQKHQKSNKQLRIQLRIR